MRQETRGCQNCKQNFTIEPEDFNFYKKIDVPPPTWCPECRLLRKILWRSDIGFYRRPDSRTGKMIFAGYPQDAPIKVWDYDYWISDSWDPLDYGKEYDWSKPFFGQFADLIKNVPWPSLAIINSVNSPYCNNGTNIKDSYLVFGSTNAEDSFASFALMRSKSIFDSSYIHDSELSYQVVFNRKCYRAFYSNHCKDSYDIYFSKDCVNVSNCFGCIGLKNKSYCIFNKQFTKDEYLSFIEKANLGSYKAVQDWIRKSSEEWIKFPRKFMWGSNNISVTGEYINNCKNVSHSYYVYNGENLKYCQNLSGGTAKDCYDYFRFSNNGELVYETLASGEGISNMRFCFNCYPSCVDMSYSVYCGSSSNIFGCIGLKSKQYCILNKQYTKDEYESLIPKIIEHMDKMPYVDKAYKIYKYGEFFPPELSPLAFNQSIAPEFFPITETDAVAKGYRWGDVSEKDYKVTINHAELPDNIKDVDDSILSQVISCVHEKNCLHPCSTAFRIVPRELEFYRQFNIPLPRLCFSCRHYERLKLRNSFRLTKRRCMCAGENSENGMYKNETKHLHGDEVCLNKFETSYAPDRPEIVYCETCYNSEVA
ncbi:MAG: hypothetical protein Q7K44_03415 [Candidatus Liptonbacteria bacterium]|nr:hypothetical protein [Candidatus Liptonbacteria bacterium]